MPFDDRNCPGAERLAAFWLGQLDVPSLEAVAHHVSRCRRCAENLRDLEPVSDAFVGNFRNLHSQCDPGLDPECQRMEQFARGLHLDAGVGPPRAADQPQGELLGNYRLLEKLGEGGMGTVWKAEHAYLKRRVVVKLLSDEYRNHPRAVAHFCREMEAVARLDHPNLIRATDAGVAGGRPFLVMEHAVGLDLGRLVKRHGPLAIAAACELVRQAALGLQYIHEQGLVHRDVKPSNLLLTTEGRVKVLDLGLARLWEWRSPGTELLGRPALATVDYLAPEQHIDVQRVDIRADVYSLGCTLFHLLTGTVPFPAPRYHSRAEKLRAHAEAPVPLVTDLRPDASAELAGVVNRMLAKAPAERHASPGKLARKLAPWAAGAELAQLLAGLQPVLEGPIAPGVDRSANDSSTTKLWRDAALRPGDGPTT